MFIKNYTFFVVLSWAPLNCCRRKLEVREYGEFPISNILPEWNMHQQLKQIKLKFSLLIVSAVWKQIHWLGSTVHMARAKALLLSEGNDAFLLRDLTYFVFCIFWRVLIKWNCTHWSWWCPQQVQPWCPGGNHQQAECLGKVSSDRCWHQSPLVSPCAH